jgi:hypothetical protein
MGGNSFSLCNYFIAKKNFWNGYFEFVEENLKKIEDVCVGNPDLAKIYFGSGYYHRDKRISMRPFVIERLFSNFIYCKKQYRCKSYPFEFEKYVSKFGSQLGGLLFRLSSLKNKGIAEGDKALICKWDEMRQVILSDSYKLAIWHLDDPATFFSSREFNNLMCN